MSDITHTEPSFPSTRAAGQGADIYAEGQRKWHALESERDQLRAALDESNADNLAYAKIAQDQEARIRTLQEERDEAVRRWTRIHSGLSIAGKTILDLMEDSPTPTTTSLTTETITLEAVAEAIEPPKESL